MKNLDDDLTAAILQRMEESQAAKILAKFDSAKVSQIVEIIYAGTQKKMTLPEDLQGNGENGSEEVQ